MTPNIYSRQLGLVVYAGPSLFDGEPIVAVVTLHSENGKTGDVVQSWFIRSDMPPVDAAACDADMSVCADCRHRGVSCYVNLGQAPLSVYNAYRAGRYPVADRQLLLRFIAGRVVRLGSYGDPAAVPQSVIDDMCRYAVDVIGYTHQWGRPGAEHLRSRTMASVDTKAELRAAVRMGWRTFRAARHVADPDAPERAYGDFEIDCPSSRGVHCIDCLACNGLASPNRPNVVIPVHGARSVNFTGD